MMLPKARTHDLNVRELVDETVIYDLERHKAHSLNAAASFVWRNCDGKTSIAELARLLHAELKLPESEELVRLALDQLARRHLLEDATPTVLPAPALLSRRDALRKLAAAAIALPVIMTITRRKAWAITEVNESQACPPGTTVCAVVTNYFVRAKVCCTAGETCVNGQCVANQAAKTPACIPNGGSCVVGQLCCNNTRCPNGSTC
jgi:hypothetical protein